MTTTKGMVAAAFALVGACDRDRDDSVAPETERDDPMVPANVAVERIQQDSRALLGKRVTAVGEVDTVFGDRVFELEGYDWWFDPTVLVVTRSPVRFGATTLENNDDVVVTGEVRRLHIANIEREIGWDLTSELEVEYREKPILVADSIRKVADAARWSERDEPEGVTVNLWAIGVPAPPAAFVGTSATLDDIPIQRTTGKGVWVGYSHADQLFVAQADGSDLNRLKPGDRVDVVGTFQKMPAADDAIARFGMDPALRPEIAEEQLYLEASRIRPATTESGAPKGDAP